MIVINEEIMTAIDNGADIVVVTAASGSVLSYNGSMAGGVPLSSIDLKTLKYAADHNVIIVIAAGNNPDALQNYTLPNSTGAIVVNVGALDGSIPASFSSLINIDIYVDGKAPGGNEGTSYAAPRAAAIIAAQLAATQDPDEAVENAENSPNVLKGDGRVVTVIPDTPRGSLSTEGYTTPLANGLDYSQAINAGIYTIVTTDNTANLDHFVPYIDTSGEGSLGKDGAAGEGFIGKAGVTSDPDMNDVVFHSLNSNGGGGLDDPDRYLNSSFGTWGASDASPFTAPPFFFAQRETGGWDSARYEND
jgi:hypothetical protein